MLKFKHYFKRNAVFGKGLEIKLVENTKCVCKEGRLVIPKPLQRRAVLWYHHYLQHPGHTRLEDRLDTVERLVAQENPEWQARRIDHETKDFDPENVRRLERNR